VRSLGGIIKASVHRDGSCHYSFTTEYARKRGWPKQARHREHWQRPTDNLGPGTTMLFRVIVPSSELRLLARRPSGKKPITWLQAPPAGQFAEVSLVITGAEATAPNWPGKNSMRTELVKQLPLASGETLWILSRQQQMAEADLLNLESFREKLRTRVPTDRVHLAGLRGLLYDAEVDGSRKFIDVAL